MSEETEAKVFWLENWDGVAEGGIFIRNDLKNFFAVLEQEGIKPVGIKYDGTLNLEIIIEKKIT